MTIHIRNQQRSRRLDLRRIKRDLSEILGLLRLHESELSVLFVGARRMKELNGRYRGIPRETDVLSFPMGDGPAGPHDHPLGDVVVCIPKAVSQAEDRGASLHGEIRRLLVHGVLHLIGHDHEASLQERLRMRRKERQILDALEKMD